MLGMTVRAVPLVRENGFSLDIDAIKAAITPRTRAIVLNSPSNPTGRVDSEAELRALVAATEASGIWIISDEVYREIYYGDTPPPSVAQFTDRAIVVSSLSKSCSMTGFRMGWILAPDALTTAIAAVNLYNVTSATTIAQFVALEAFTKPEWLGMNRPRFIKQREAMLSALDRELGLPYHKTDGGFFAFVDMSSLGLDSLALAERLLAEADVVTVPGIAFGQNAEGFLRISFVETEDNILEGVRRIGAFIKHGR
jgi:aspartate/methionine/tyrosine aminotransferase